MIEPPESLQAAYYAKTASRYDEMHGSDLEHDRALRVVSSFVSAFGFSTVLDVGTGTGRGVRFLADRHPAARIVGLEPVRELLDVAVHNGIDPAMLVEAVGEALPFPDGSFDIVFELGVLHHVAQPSAVVREMQRVARHAVLLSDNNRFGDGPRGTRLLKLALYKARLWWPVIRARNRGRRYRVSEGDGVSYSYSVYDDVGLFDDWASVEIIATREPSARDTWLHPLLTTPHVLLCAMRDANPLDALAPPA
jgi:ubiquinone/menaquinone biosynthesis C-methylase UbiE